MHPGGAAAGTPRSRSAVQPSPVDPSLPDAELVRRSRAGDADAFAALWDRHHRAALAVARSTGAAADADDLVQEAFARVFGILRRGGGPTGPFRAYLFTAIRNTAVSWARARHDTAAIDELEAVPDPTTTEDALLAADDHGRVLRAFRTLPSRWQEVLWYCEVEGLGPGEAAPLLGMTPGAVKQLAFRAREGLREAWIQAHVATMGDGEDCRRTIERLGAHARGTLTASRRARVDAHLQACPPCAEVAAEARHVGTRLAPALLPALIGSAAAAAYLTPAGRAMAAASALTPLPAALAPTGALTIAASGTLAVGALVSTGFATLALAGALVGGAVAAAPVSPAPVSDLATTQAPMPGTATPPVAETRSAAPETTPAPAVTAPSAPVVVPPAREPSLPVPIAPAPTPPGEVTVAAEVAGVVDLDVAAGGDGVSAGVNALDSVRGEIAITEDSATIDGSAGLTVPVPVDAAVDAPIDASIDASIGAGVSADPSPEAALGASVDGESPGAAVDASLGARVEIADGAATAGVDLEVADPIG